LSGDFREIEVEAEQNISFQVAVLIQTAVRYSSGRDSLITITVLIGFRMFTMFAAAGDAIL